MDPVVLTLLRQAEYLGALRERPRSPAKVVGAQIMLGVDDLTQNRLTESIFAAALSSRPEVDPKTVVEKYFALEGTTEDSDEPVEEVSADDVDPDDYNGKGVEWADSGQGKSQEEIMADMRAFQEVLAGQSSQVFVPNQDASMPVTDDIWSDAHNADFF